MFEPLELIVPQFSHCNLYGLQVINRQQFDKLRLVLLYYSIDVPMNKDYCRAILNLFHEQIISFEMHDMLFCIQSLVNALANSIGL